MAASMTFAARTARPVRGLGCFAFSYRIGAIWRRLAGKSSGTTKAPRSNRKKLPAKNANLRETPALISAIRG
jgi:hypothetical protein